MGNVSVTYTLKIDYPPSLRSVAEFITPNLVEILTEAAEPVGAEWDRVVDDRGQDLLVLRLTDFAGTAAGVFDAEEQRDIPKCNMALRRIISRLLGTRLSARLKRLNADIEEAA